MRRNGATQPYTPGATRQRNGSLSAPAHGQPFGNIDNMSQRGEDTAIGAGVGGVAGAVLTGGSAVGTVGGAVVGGVVGNQIRK